MRKLFMAGNRRGGFMNYITGTLRAGLKSRVLSAGDSIAPANQSIKARDVPLLRRFGGRGLL
jgi:hypothetical protein